MFADETNSTLQFASRAKTIQNKPQVNEVMDEHVMLKRLQLEVSDLRKQLSERRAAVSEAEIKLLEAQKLQIQSENEQLQNNLTEQKQIAQQQDDKINKLKQLLLVHSRLAPVDDSINNNVDSNSNTTTTSATSDVVPKQADDQLKPRKENRRETWAPGDFQIQNHRISSNRASNLQMNDANNKSTIQDIVKIAENHNNATKQQLKLENEALLQQIENLSNDKTKLQTELKITHDQLSLKLFEAQQQIQHLEQQQNHKQ